MTAERGPRSRRKVLALVALLAAVLLVGSTALVWPTSADPDAADDGTYAESDGSPDADAVAPNPRATGTSASRPNSRRARDVVDRAEADGVAIGGVGDLATAVDGAAAAAARDAAAKRADFATAPDAASPKTSEDGGGGRRGAVTAADAVVLVVQLKAAESDAPVTNADVQVVAADGLTRSVRPDFQGRASFMVPAGEMASIDAKAPGRVRGRLKVTTKRAGETAVVLALERGVVVQGRVTDDRRAVAGATVTAYALAPWLEAPPYDADPTPIETTTSDRRGAYRLDCIPRGVACALVVEAEKHAASKEDVEPQPDPDYVVRRDVTLARGDLVEGIVWSAETKPVEGAWAYAFNEQERSNDDARWRSLKLSDDDKCELSLLSSIRVAREGRRLRAPRARTGADGKFRLWAPRSWAKTRLIAMHPLAGRSIPSPAIAAGGAQLGLTLRGRVRAEFDVRSPDDEGSVTAVLPVYAG